jgi:KaiC/GvpD/RAD55 family RecA-like ATPase
MLALQLVNHSEDINSFLDFLYLPTDEGYVYAPTKDAETGEFKQDFFKWPEDRPKLVEWVLRTTAKAEVYIAPALFSVPSAQKEAFKSTNVLWTEFDGNYPDSFGDVPGPSLRVQSSDESHQHCYWRLDVPVTDFREVEALNRTITYGLNADASAWDCNQVLRPPGTVNHKRDTLTQLAYVSPVVYPTGLFVPTYPTAVVTEFNTDVIPDVTDIVYKYEFPPQVSSLLRTKDLPVGDRSTAMMRLGFYCAEMGMSDAEIFSVIRNADDRWGKFKGRTDRDKRLIDLISRVREKYPATDYQTDVIPVFGFESFMEHEIHVEWLVDGLLQERGYMLLTGPSGVGKTQFTLRMCINMALGRKEFAGEKIMRPVKILVFSLEMAHADLKYFLSIMAKDFTKEDTELLEKNLILVPHGESIYLNQDEGRNQLTDIIEAIEPDVVVIDSMGSTSSGGLSNEDTVKSIMDFNDKIRKKYGVATWFIHHMRKASGDNKKPNKLDDVYGNQYIVNRATTVLCLWPNRDNKIDVIPLKIRLGAKRDTWAVHRIGNLDFERTASVSIMMTQDDVQAPVKITNNSFGDI